MPTELDSPSTPPWLRPPVEQTGLEFYVEVLRERFRIVIATVVVTLIAAVAYLVTAEKVYEATAHLLVSPVPADDPVLASLGLPRASSDPSRDVETVASLATSLDVAAEAKQELGTDRSAGSLRGGVSAKPVASSNLVTITAEASSPEDAAELANAFAVGLVADRTDTLHAQIDQILPRLESRLDQPGSELPDETIAAQIGQLEVLRSGQDPTVRVESEAEPPNGPASPRRMLTIAAALLAGLVLGVGGAFTAQTLDPRLRREQQLRSRYSLPILARIPRDSSRRGGPLGPAMLSPHTREAYRTLRANISAARRNPKGSHALLVTGSAPAEGKTTTALNLAVAIALAGERVILIEADLRRPSIADTLGITVDRGVVSALLENVSLDDALLTTAPFGLDLKLLLADRSGGWMSELFSLPAAERLVEEAKTRADAVIIDSPPLTAVVDTLPLARMADDVLVVSRLGTTRLDKLRELAELLASNRISPVGFALVGAPRPGSSYYYDSSTSAAWTETPEEPADEDEEEDGEGPPDEGGNEWPGSRVARRAQRAR